MKRGQCMAEPRVPVDAHLRIERERWAAYKMRAYFLDTGAYRRELYPQAHRL